MTKYLTLVSLGLACALAVRLASGADGDAQRVPELARDLANDEFSVRQKAEAALRGLPIDALPALLLALRDCKDPEAIDRLHSILLEQVGKLCFVSRGHTVTVNVHAKPLREVLQSIAPQLELDADAFLSILPASRVAAPVSFQVENMEDRYALRWLFRAAGVDPLTSSQPVERNYDLSGAPLKPDFLVSILSNKQGVIARPPEAELKFKADGDKLTLSANPETQERFALLVQQLHAQKDPKFFRMAFEDTAWRDAAMAALRQKKVSFDFAEAHLADAIAEVQRQIGMPMFIDSKYETTGMAPVTLLVSEMPADLALEWLANCSGTAMSTKDHALCFTRVDERSDQQCAILDLRELLNTPGLNYTLASIADMLKTRVRPDAWDPALGTSIEEIAGHLVVMQTPEVMDLCQEFLALHARYAAMIRKVEPGGKPPARPLDPTQVPAENLARNAPPWRDELKTRLNKTVTLNYDAVPLGQVLKDLAKTTGATLILDPRLGMGTDTVPVTLQVKDVKAEDALKQIVHAMDLEFEFRAGAVFISKHANLSCNVELSIYYVRDLASVATTSDLVTLVHDWLCPADFADPATSIAEQNGMLVVMASPECQQKIQNVLTTLRLHWKEKAILLASLDSKTPQPGLTAWLYRVDDIKGPTPAALADTIKTTIEPKSWDPALGTFVAEFTNRLMVMQTLQRQKLVAEWLEKQRNAAK